MQNAQMRFSKEKQSMHRENMREIEAVAIAELQFWQDDAGSDAQFVQDAKSLLIFYLSFSEQENV